MKIKTILLLVTTILNTNVKAKTNLTLGHGFDTLRPNSYFQNCINIEQVQKAGNIQTNLKIQKIQNHVINNYNYDSSMNVGLDFTKKIKLNFSAENKNKINQIIKNDKIIYLLSFEKSFKTTRLSDFSLKKKYIDYLDKDQGEKVKLLCAKNFISGVTKKVKIQLAVSINKSSKKLIQNIDQGFKLKNLFKGISIGFNSNSKLVNKINQSFDKFGLDIMVQGINNNKLISNLLEKNDLKEIIDQTKIIIDHASEEHAVNSEYESSYLFGLDSRIPKDNISDLSKLSKVQTLLDENKSKILSKIDKLEKSKIFFNKQVNIDNEINNLKYSLNTIESFKEYCHSNINECELKKAKSLSKNIASLLLNNNVGAKIRYNCDYQLSENQKFAKIKYASLVFALNKTSQNQLKNNGVMLSFQKNKESQIDLETKFNENNSRVFSFIEQVYSDQNLLKSEEHIKSQKVSKEKLNLWTLDELGEVQSSVINIDYNHPQACAKSLTKEEMKKMILL
jgi:hypothetical protein